MRQLAVQDELDVVFPAMLLSTRTRAPRDRLTLRTKVYDTARVKGSEFLRKLHRLARDKGVAMEFAPAHGKGSHGRVYFGPARTALKDLKKEMGPGLLRKMCRDLGIDPKDL